jgi:predicted transcriptional regulator
MFAHLPRAGPFPILKSMEVHFTPEQEAQLAQIATNEGTEPERLVKDAALRLLQEDGIRAAVREGIAQADRGEFIEEAEMDGRLEQQFEAKLAALRTVIDQGDATGAAQGDSFQRVRRTLKLFKKKS